MQSERRGNSDRERIWRKIIGGFPGGGMCVGRAGRSPNVSHKSFVRAPSDLPTRHPNEYGRLGPLPDHPCRAGLLSDSCSSGLNCRRRLPSDSASGRTPLPARTVPLITARRGFPFPESMTCLAHNKNPPRKSRKDSLYVLELLTLDAGAAPLKDVHQFLQIDHARIPARRLQQRPVRRPQVHAFLRRLAR
jgi:hypothetical protein